MSDVRDRIEKLLRLARDAGAAPAEAASALRHASRLLGLLGLTEADLPGSGPREPSPPPPGPWSGFRPQSGPGSECSGCPLFRYRPRDCGSCEP